MSCEDEDVDLAAKYRDRRRRRLDGIWMAAVSAATISSSSQTREDDNPCEQYSSFSTKRICTEADEVKDVSSSSSASNSSAEDVEVSSTSKVSSLMLRRASEMEPVYGAMSVMGRSRDMEDAIAVLTNLCRPKISNLSPVHFFAVYDGHGGSHVAALCRKKMHELLEEELMRVEGRYEIVSGETSNKAAQEIVNEDVEDCERVAQLWRRVMRMIFERLDTVALTICACGRVRQQCSTHSMEVSLGGTTASVAILTPEHIVVANCGDSRAVLCRGGVAIALSKDHKPDRPDERARIEAAGGRVISLDGPRVEGILAMSRAIGDKYLKPFVTSEPEVTVTKRSPNDECLVLATDGLWDVMSSEDVCEIALKCLGEAGDASTRSSNIELNAEPPIVEEGTESAEASSPTGSNSAAALLTRLALARKSSDNISVVVVDLKRIRNKKM